MPQSLTHVVGERRASTSLDLCETLSHGFLDKALRLWHEEEL